MKYVEFIGVAHGIIGAFLVANGIMSIGYPAFTISSLLLAYTAWKQGNKNLLLLQGVFFCANVNGLITFF